MAKDFFYERARYTERTMRPYVTAVGQTALAWNDLHEYLGRFFGYFGVGKNRNVGLAIWQSSRVDRAKRQMLTAAICASPARPADDPFPRFKEDLLWLLDRTEALEDLRNDVVHAPLLLSVDLSKVGRVPSGGVAAAV